MTAQQNPLEFLAFCISRTINDHEVVYAGTGLPLVGALLAKATHAPHITLVFESGSQDPVFTMRMPWSVSCPWTYHLAPLTLDMATSFGQVAAGYIDLSFMGGAQIDMYGNVNTTVIGSMEKVKHRLPGSGGANDLGSLSERYVLVGLQTKEKFPERVDFITTPGHLNGGDSRQKAGLLGSGPEQVITQVGVFGFHPESKRMMALTLHPGITPEIVAMCTGFEIIIPDDVGVTELPDETTLEILRTKVDPYRVFTNFPV
ncbi:MAG TPA: CoA-transferase [Syntrophomonas sp.]|nr:CoA-transferase [Syntrophomonas sp.]